MQPKSSLVGNFMSFHQNMKDNISVARSHLVFLANLKDKIMHKSKNILLLYNFFSLGAKREKNNLVIKTTVPQKYNRMLNIPYAFIT